MVQVKLVFSSESPGLSYYEKYFILPVKPELEQEKKMEVFVVFYLFLDKIVNSNNLGVRMNSLCCNLLTLQLLMGMEPKLC